MAARYEAMYGFVVRYALPIDFVNVCRMGTVRDGLSNRADDASQRLSFVYPGSGASGQKQCLYRHQACKITHHIH
jgi:hypothetical protein